MSYTYPEGGPPADLLVEATGKTLGEAFANLALGMFNTMTPIGDIAEEEEFVIEAQGDDLDSLLFNLMDEFLYLNDVEFLVPRRMEVSVDEKYFHAEALCVGERFSRDTHETGIAVKAVTYHMMEIKRVNGGYRVRMVFDT
ncbi:MAG: archease [Candidatus Bathyarchaeota archaeon]